jgi:hypothetical protein
MRGMAVQSPIWMYLTNGIVTGFIWAHFFWPERQRRQLSIASIMALMFMEAVTFAMLRWIILQEE